MSGIYSLIKGRSLNKEKDENHSLAKCADTKIKFKSNLQNWKW